MEYQLTAELAPPAGAPDLDPLQRHGVAALLDEQLDRLAAIDGPDGIEIEPLDHSVTVHATGARVSWLMDSPALAFAEDAAGHVLGEVLEETELLADWTVLRCEATASDDELAAALGAIQAGDSGEDSAEDDGEEGPAEDTAADLERDRHEHRARLHASARALLALSLDAFGAGEDGCATEEQATLLAGALVQGVETLTDDLFQDVRELEEADSTADEHESLWALDLLPEQYAHHYTALFAKQFLVTTAILGYRLCQPDWAPPLCAAEALALHLVKAKAQLLLELYGLHEELPLEQMLACFDEAAFADLDHEWLYQPSDVDDDPELAVDEWFRPYAVDALHPYLTEQTDPAELDA